MKKLLVCLLAVGAVCFVIYQYLPESTHTAFNIPRLNFPVSYLLIGGLITGSLFWRWMAGK